jgi:hypothetical protein
VVRPEMGGSPSSRLASPESERDKAGSSGADAARELEAARRRSGLAARPSAVPGSDAFSELTVWSRPRCRNECSRTPVSSLLRSFEATRLSGRELLSLLPFTPFGSIPCGASSGGPHPARTIGLPRLAGIGSHSDVLSVRIDGYIGVAWDTSTWCSRRYTRSTDGRWSPANGVERSCGDTGWLHLGYAVDNAPRSRAQ